MSEHNVPIPTETVLVSACLLGMPVRYDGQSCASGEGIRRKWPHARLVAVCPEQLGGLSTPRTPTEIDHADGEAVLCGRARVVDAAGGDHTAAFVAGAEQVLTLARQHQARRAVLKNKSPSCGYGCIYDGSFSGKLITGNGVTTALLLQHGVRVISG